MTGANGFLGRHLIAGLTEHGAKIHALSRSVPPCTDGVQWVQGDLTNEVQVLEVVRRIKPALIYQLASSSQGGQDARFVLPNFENDLRSTVNVLLAAKAYGCQRIVLAASLEEPVLDGRPITVSSPYAAAKASCTYYGLMFHQLYGVPVTLLRLFMTYGPGQKPYKLIPYTISSLLKNQPPKLSSGIRPVDWVYVEDVIPAFISASVTPDAVGAVIDIGSGSLVKVREVVEELWRQIPGSPAPHFGALPDRIMETVRCAEIDPAIRILDWKATTPLSAGLCRTVEWFRERIKLTDTEDELNATTLASTR